MDPTSLHRLLYRSDMALPGGTDSFSGQIDGLITTACARNAERGITGAIIAMNGMFIQALEGRADKLERLFETICCDLRHRHVRLVEFAPADKRVFPGWGMIRVDGEKGVQDPQSLLHPSDLERLSASESSKVISVMRSILQAA